MTWRELGACFETFNKDFFPRTGETGRRARAVCNACPVTDDCIDFALATHVQYGIWGGKSVRELREMRA